MNKRLQELYLVASEQFKIVQDQGLPAPYQTRAFAEKFAELIVRECANSLMKPSVMEWDEGLRSELSDYNKGWVDGRLLGIKHIKERFGVEE